MPTVAVLHHLERPFLGHAGRWLRDAGVELDERHVLRGDPLPDLGEVDGIVSLGGETSVRTIAAQPALEAEAELLRAAVQREVPLLGICLGGQLLAHALGGTVRYAGRVLVWRDLHPTAEAHDDPVFAELPDPVPALHFNEDVFDAPPGAVTLLEGPGIDGAEAFRAGRCAWAVQYHPDVDAPVLESWFEHFGPWIDAAGANLDAVREESARREAAQEAASAALFGAFGRFVAAVPA